MTTNEQTKGYFPALDGLRTICFSSVVLGHAFANHPLETYFGRAANMGVRVFFALSGFLITSLLLREHTKSGRVDLRAFYMRRVLRIFPVYYVAVAIGIGGIIALGQHFTRPLGVDPATTLNVPSILGTHALFVANWFNQPIPTSLDVLWSVSVEEQFYLLFPITFAFSRRKVAAGPSISIGLVLALVVRLVLCLTDSVHSIERNTFAIGDHLLLGAAAAQALHIAKDRTTALVQRLGVVGQVGPLLTLVALCIIPRSSWLAWFIEPSISAVAAALLVLSVAVSGGPVVGFFATNPMRKLGQLTYSAYVFHMYPLVVAWAVVGRLGLGPTAAASARTVLGAAGAFIVAMITRSAFERRLLQYKHRFSRTDDTAMNTR